MLLSLPVSPNDGKTKQTLKSMQSLKWFVAKGVALRSSCSCFCSCPVLRQIGVLPQEWIGKHWCIKFNKATGWGYLFLSVTYVGSVWKFTCPQWDTFAHYINITKSIVNSLSWILLHSSCWDALKGKKKNKQKQTTKVSVFSSHTTQLFSHTGNSNSCLWITANCNIIGHSSWFNIPYENQCVNECGHKISNSSSS